MSNQLYFRLRRLAWKNRLIGNIAWAESYDEQAGQAEYTPEAEEKADELACNPSTTWESWDGCLLRYGRKEILRNAQELAMPSYLLVSQCKNKYGPSKKQIRIYERYCKLLEREKARIRRENWKPSDSTDMMTWSEMMGWPMPIIYNRYY